MTDFCCHMKLEKNIFYLSKGMKDFLAFIQVVFHLVARNFVKFLISSDPVMTLVGLFVISDINP